MWSSTGEGLGLFVVGNVVVNNHRPELLLPGMAPVVGLHFLPIGWAATFRPFYALGGALILGAILGAGIASPLGGAIAGFLGAVGLWTAEIAAVRRDRLAKSAAGLTDNRVPKRPLA